MNDIAFLAPVERPRLDTTQIEYLCADLGAPGAEDVVCRAMEELGTRLFQAQETALSGDRDTLYRDLRVLSAIADQIGLVQLSQVAADVRQCIADRDPVAEAATLARLARVGERSLAALWDLQDLSV